MTLTHDDVRKILAILDESDCEEVHLEFGDVRLHLHRHGGEPGLRGARGADEPAARPSPELADEGRGAPTQPDPARGDRTEPIPEGTVGITAPMLGIFYRSPSPGEKPFVEVGDKVTPDDTVCLLEVMKLFNSVKAGAAGMVEEILVENGALVEYGQRLMLIRRDSA